MKILHVADLHYGGGEDQLKWVDRAFEYAVNKAIEEECDLAVLAGDSFHSSLPLHHPAVLAFVSSVALLAEVMPVIVLQGTFSHDAPGSLDVLRELRSEYEIYVADSPSHLAVVDYGDDGLGLTDNLVDSALLDVFMLPSLNRADRDVMDEGPAKYVERLCREWGDIERGSPSILITHGTVVGSVTESGYAMVSPDHEFTVETLASAKTDVVMLGHIHKHQHFHHGKTHIAYPGSIARLVYGQHDPTGFLIWDIDEKGATPTFHEAPSRSLLEIGFDGPPDIADLKKYALEVDGDVFVRIRYEIDEEHATSVDKALIRDIFSHAGGIKIVATVGSIQEVRVEGISKQESMAEKFKAWAKMSDSEQYVDTGLDRIEMLETMDAVEIVEALTQ